MSRLKGRKALVTGASRGIGRLVAQALAAEGAELLVHARSLSHLTGVLDTIRQAGGVAEPIAAELDDPKAVEALIDEVLKLGGVDILYNNAGVMPVWKELADRPLEDWHKNYQVNFLAPMRLCARLSLPMKSKGWGRIVNVSTGMKALPQLSPYSTSKAALDKYTNDLAHGLKGTGVVVSLLDPGWLKTDLGGPNAEHEVETVLPGALAPVIVPDYWPSGLLFRAQDFKGDGVL